MGARTGRGAPVQPATAFIPAIASVALRCAAARVVAVGPITTGPSAKAVIRAVRNLSVADNVPDTIATSQVPCTSGVSGKHRAALV